MLKSAPHGSLHAAWSAHKGGPPAWGRPDGAHENRRYGICHDDHAGVRAHLRRAAREVAYRTRNDEISITWGEARERVAELACGSRSSACAAATPSPSMLANRPEFHLYDLAVLMTGATPFSVYQTSPPNQIRYIVSDSGARVMITEQSFLPRILEARTELPALETVIVIDGEAPAGVLTPADLPAADPGFDLEAAAEAVDAEDLLTLIYTSAPPARPRASRSATAPSSPTPPGCSTTCRTSSPART